MRGKGYIADDFTDHALDFIEQNQGEAVLLLRAVQHAALAVGRAGRVLAALQGQADRAARDATPARKKLDQTRCALAMWRTSTRTSAACCKRSTNSSSRENTIVIYFSDNGPNAWRWNGGMKGSKGSTDEGGVRSPCLHSLAGGGIRPGTTVREIAGAIDLLPTLTALAGVKRVGDKPLDGRDLSPLAARQGARLAGADDLLAPERQGQCAHAAVSPRRSRARSSTCSPIPARRRTSRRRQPGHRRAAWPKAVAAWRAEVLPKAKDDRPFPVGYAEFPRTPLPARDGVPHGGVKRSAGAPNCSYFVNWTSRDDTMTWDIEVNTTGDIRRGDSLHLPAGRCRLDHRTELQRRESSPAKSRPAGIRRSTPIRTPSRARRRIADEGIPPADTRHDVARKRPRPADAARAGDSRARASWMCGRSTSRCDDDCVEEQVAGAEHRY